MNNSNQTIATKIRQQVATIKHLDNADLDQLLDIAIALEEGNETQALIISQNLDTIVREEIPTEVYNYLTK